RKRRKNPAGKFPPPYSDPFLMMVGFVLWVDKTLVVRFCACSVSLKITRVRETGRSTRCPFEFHKRDQLFIRTRQSGACDHAQLEHERERHENSPGFTGLNRISRCLFG